MSTILNVARVDDENTEFTLATTLVGVPVHEAVITNADESPDTFTNPTPLITIVCPIPLSTGITPGVKDVTETTLNMPARK